MHGAWCEVVSVILSPPAQGVVAQLVVDLICVIFLLLIFINKKYFLLYTLNMAELFV